MATAKKLPSGSWRVNAYIGRDENGKQLRKSFTADTKKAAELAAAQYIAQEHHEADPENISVGKAVRQYIDNKSQVLSPATIRGYETILNTLPDAFFALPVASLDNKRFQAFINQYCVGRSPKTVSNAYGLIMAAVKFHDPFKQLLVSLPQRQKKEICIPSSIEIKNLLASVQGTPWEVPILLAAYMGLRRSEIIALTWADIDFTKATLRINKAKVLGADMEYHQKTTKTTSGTRTLTIPDSVLTVLKAQDKARPVCCLSASALTGTFHKQLARCGIEPFNFHSLRHYYASVLLSLNVPNKYAQARMGHSTDNMLKTVYQHLMEDKQNEVDTAINNFFK